MARRGKLIPFPGLWRAAPRSPEPPAEAFVEVYRCDSAEALVVRSLLESEAIPVLLRSRIAHSVHPFSVGGQGEVVVLVPEAEGPKSRRLLARVVRQSSQGG